MHGRRCSNLDLTQEKAILARSERFIAIRSASERSMALEMMTHLENKIRSMLSRRCVRLGYSGSKSSGKKESLLVGEIFVW